MSRGFHMGGAGGNEQPSGVIIPANKTKFSQLYADTGVVLTCTPTSVTKSGSSGWGHVGTIETYDFTNFTTLSFNITISNSTADDVFLGYSAERYTGKLIYQHMIHVDKRGVGTYTVTVNITNVTGYFYIIIGSGNLKWSVSSVMLT